MFFWLGFISAVLSRATKVQVADVFVAIQAEGCTSDVN